MTEENIFLRGFVSVSQSEYEKNGWILRFEKGKFELFTDPEKDTDYIYADISLLEEYLEDKEL